MVEAQKKRFEEEGHLQTVQNYLADPNAGEAEYLKMLDNESVAQYRDYFQS